MFINRSVTAVVILLSFTFRILQVSWKRPRNVSYTFKSFVQYCFSHYQKELTITLAGKLFHVLIFPAL